MTSKVDTVAFNINTGSVLHTGGRETRGPSPRDMVCCVCYRFFIVETRTWQEAERKPCPYCHSRETTPMLGEYHNAVPVLVSDGKGGYR